MCLRSRLSAQTRRGVYAQRSREAAEGTSRRWLRGAQWHTTMRDLKTSRGAGGHWLFEVIGGPVDACFVFVVDEESAVFAWCVTSFHLTGEVYPGTVTVLETSRMEEVSEEQAVAELIAAGVAPEVAADGSDHRPVSTFEYGVVPEGFHAVPDCPAAPLVADRRYSVMILSGAMVPVARGSFTG